MKVIVPLDEQAGQSSKISEHFGYKDEIIICIDVFIWIKTK